MHNSLASGSILLTIEQRRIDQEQQHRLEAASAAAPIYLPLRELRAVEPDDAGLRAIREADIIVITSGFALSTYLSHPEWRDAPSSWPPLMGRCRETNSRAVCRQRASRQASQPIARASIIADGLSAELTGGEKKDRPTKPSNSPVLRSPTLLLLSARMAAVARDSGMKATILTPPEENQRGVAALLKGMRYRHAVHLCGSLSSVASAAHSALPDDVERVQIYENHWDGECESRACDAIDAAIAHGSNRTEDAGDLDNIQPPAADRRIDRILVTSPSAYRRLRSVMRRIPRCFAASPVYYTLGPSTTAAVETDGGTAVSPGSRDNVLHAAIERLLVDGDSADQ